MDCWASRSSARRFFARSGSAWSAASTNEAGSSSTPISSSRSLVPGDMGAEATPESAGALAVDHVDHRVTPGRLAHDGPCRPEGAAREELPVRGPVGELDPFALAKQVDGMVADDVAASDRMDADLLGLARPDV